MNGISSIAHVALKVRDLDRSLDFYTGKLGFQEMMRLDKPNGAPGVWLVYLRITDTQYLELFPEGQGERAPGWNDTAINHICLGVDDLDNTLAHLEAVAFFSFCRRSKPWMATGRPGSRIPTATASNSCR